MKKYIIPFLLVLLGLMLPSIGINQFLAYGIKTLLGLGAIIYFWKQYKEIKLRFDWQAWLFGLIIIVMWIALEFLNKGNGSGYDPTPFSGALFYLVIISKLVGMVAVAAIVEELFMRSFLVRVLINPAFEKVKIGHFTWMSFILTTAFFGLMHGSSFTGSRMVVGLISGAMFNLFLYYRKDVFSCIQCHASANLFLAIYALTTQNWILW